MVNNLDLKNIIKDIDKTILLTSTILSLAEEQKSTVNIVTSPEIAAFLMDSEHFLSTEQSTDERIKSMNAILYGHLKNHKLFVNPYLSSEAIIGNIVLNITGLDLLTNLQL